MYLPKAFALAAAGFLVSCSSVSSVRAEESVKPTVVAVTPTAVPSPYMEEAAVPTLAPQPTSEPTPAPKPTPSAKLSSAKLVYNTTDAEVLWTFDDCEYGTRGNVAQILVVLRAHKIQRAIFFMTGDCYNARPDLVALVKNAGYEIGNHTKTHADLTKLSEKDIAAEIEGGPPGTTEFRPPYGAVNAAVLSVASRYGYTQVMLWSASGGDSSDGGRRTCNRILEDLRGTVRPGAIVLLHMFIPTTPAALNAYLSGKSNC
jgi:peptidoglycan/xylan/chitin deacetylase (PgdA/CDA1 family)